MTLHRLFKSWGWSIFILGLCIMLVSRLESLRQMRPFVASANLVFLACWGYWFVEAALLKRHNEKGTVWHKIWPAYLILGVAILSGLVIVIGNFLACQPAGDR